MKNIFTILTISFSVLSISGISFAAPQDRKYENQYQRSYQPNNHNSHDNNDDQRFEKRRIREERGVKRLQQHQWQAGYVLPQHYRGNRYKVEYKEHNLQKPNNNEQWYKINNDYILVDPESNNIIKIINH
ncbi:MULTISPECIES: RcnB family protein [unclassified Acinetobacter]|uniref:RcnB family protein n=1 Tax=unclassified Acinetobacter TaxID=196816 RepID=UPI0029344432|nr:MULTISPECIES: RcnB family protein [unclassified Acinetobacter]WOE30809.1 RcnB family protein [Acinetobacter sp. SAAs470]WOE39004.1 RcnB family protein [Acinetobacter sp. SAAs474]